MTYTQEAEKTLQWHERQLMVINDVALAMSKPLELKETLRQALNAVLQIGPFDHKIKGAILLLDEREQLLRRGADVGCAQNLPCYQRPVRVGECLCGLAAAERTIVIRRHRSAATAEAHTCNDHLDVCVPLQSGGDLVGVMNLWLSPEADIQSVDQLFLEAVSHQIASAIQRAQANQKACRRSYEMSVVSRVGQFIASTLDLDEVLPRVVDEARALLRAERTSVLLHSSPEEDFVVAAAAGRGAQSMKGMRMPISDGIAGHVLQTGEPTLVEDAHSDPRFCTEIDQRSGLITGTLLAAPLYCSGRPLGVIEALNSGEHPFSQHDLEILIALAGYAGIAIGNAQLHQAELDQRKLVEESQSQLSQTDRMAAVGRLSASLAHELGNPLQAIHNSLQMMLSFPLDEEEQRTYIQMADEEVARLIGMVNRILTFSRHPSDEVQQVNINGVVSRVLSLANKYLQHHHISVNLALTDNLPPIPGRPGLLGQVVLNLTINAAEAMPRGGTLTVTTAHAGEDHIRIEVADTGEGMSPDVLNHLFEPFFSTKAEGTGLGLSISQSIVRQHGGSIRAMSKTGDGSVFEVTLPISHMGG